jgi:Acyl-CoA carboxylase epsilon subunit
VTEPPVLRIVAGGQPSDEETAALTAVLSLATAAADASGEHTVAPSRWRDSASPAGPWARTGWLAAGRRSAQRRPQ